MKANSTTNTLRYARQIVLSEVGSIGQQRLKDSKILVIGAGGLGCPALLYLAGAGVGTIGIIDNDTVDVSNLHRQILYSTADVGGLKVSAAKHRINQLNPDIAVKAYDTILKPENALDLLSDYDVIVDATDNFNAKYLINDACTQLDKPMVFASISQFEGQVSVFNYFDVKTQERGPCFRDLFETPPPSHLTLNCSEAGVIGVVPGLVGCLQVNEVLKLILTAGEPLSGKLLTIDCLDNTFRLLNINKKARSPQFSETFSVTTEHAWTEKDWLPSDILHHWIATEAPFQLVDVRDASEHQRGSLGGAFIPLKDIINRLGELDMSRRIVFYCKSGARSKAALLAVRGVNDAAELYCLEGGIDKYLNLYTDKNSPWTF